MNNKSMQREQLAEEDKHVEQSRGVNQHSHYTSDKQDTESEKRATQQAAAGRTDAAHDRRAQPPEDFTGIELEGVGEVAGGIPAIISTAKYAWREMGASRSLKTLAQLNQ